MATQLVALVSWIAYRTELSGFLVQLMDGKCMS